MTGTRISNTVTHTVTLGLDGVLSPLTVTDNGMIAPITAGDIGVIGRYVGDRLINHGAIAGADGVRLGAGPGAGIEFVLPAAGIDRAGTGNIMNTGTVEGGSGAYYTYQMGGAGVDLANGNLSNSGSISGGAGGYGQSFPSANGGAGVSLRNGNLINTGFILGGAGGRSAYTLAGTGGTGVVLAGGGSLSNSGTIQAGAGGFIFKYADPGTGGIGVDLRAGNLDNSGLILGGTGGYNDGAEGYGGSVRAAGVSVRAGAVLTNQGTIVGGTGGTGVHMSGGTLHNSGSITGGVPGYWGEGGTGVFIESSAAVANTGSITAGYNRFGVFLAGGTLTTSGVVSGSDGYRGGSVRFGSQGGTLVIDKGAVFNGAILGFHAAALIDSTTPITSLTFLAGTLTLKDGQAVVEQLTFGGTHVAAGFHLAADGHGGTDITYGSGPPAADFVPLLPWDVDHAGPEHLANTPGKIAAHAGSVAPAEMLWLMHGHLPL